MRSKKMIYFLLGVEILLIIFAVISCFQKTQTIKIGAEDFRLTYGIMEEDGSVYVDETAGATGEFLSINNIALKKGVWKVCLEYETDSDMTNFTNVTDGSVSFRALQCGGMSLWRGLETTEYRMWLKEDTEALKLFVNYGGMGSLRIKGCSFVRTNELERVHLAELLFGIAVVNILLYVWVYNKKNGISSKRKRIVFGLVCTVLASSLPLMTDYMLPGGDTVFHLLRIEGVRDGILSGQFPVRIDPEWLWGHGYACSVFYGDLLLYFPALLRIIGFHVMGSYKIWIWGLNIATAGISYSCFKKICKDEYAGVICSFLYTVSVYRMYKLYCVGAMGEAIATLFLPLILLGFYRIFFEDIHEKSYHTAWIPLTVGFAGLIQSHLLSTEIAGGFSVLLCILLWKKVFRKETFFVLLKAVILTILLSAWYLVPFADYMITGNFVIQNVSARRIQSRGLYPAHLLFTYFGGGGNVLFEDTGMQSTDAVGVGFVLICALLLFIILRNQIKKMDNRLYQAGKISAGLAILAMFMSLNFFPWDRLQSLNRIFATLISSLQIPNRILTIATILLVFLGGICSVTLKQISRKYFIYFTSAVAGMMLLTNIYFINDVLYTKNIMRIYNTESMGNGYISGREYLPYGMDEKGLYYNEPVGSEGIVIEGYEKKAAHMLINCQNIYAGEGYMDLPLISYKGYAAWNSDTGEKLELKTGENYALRVLLPEEFIGTVEIDFIGLWYWRAAEIISLITLIYFLWAVWRKREKHEKVRQTGLI